MNATTPSVIEIPPPAKDDLYFDGFAEVVARWIFASLIRQTAGEVARECQAVTWEKVRTRTARMTPAQARGYVRAIAPAIILREVDVVLCRRRVRVSLRRAVIAEATEQLIRLIVDDVRRSQSRPATRVRAMAA